MILFQNASTFSHVGIWGTFIAHDCMSIVVKRMKLHRNGLFSRELSLTISPACASINASTQSAGCSKALVRSSCICKDAKQCIMMYHDVQFMEVHNPHMDATPTRSM